MIPLVAHPASVPSEPHVPCLDRCLSDTQPTGTAMRPLAAAAPDLSRPRDLRKPWGFRRVLGRLSPALRSSWSRPPSPGPLNWLFLCLEHSPQASLRSVPTSSPPYVPAQGPGFSHRLCVPCSRSRSSVRRHFPAASPPTRVRASRWGWPPSPGAGRGGMCHTGF